MLETVVLIELLRRGAEVGYVRTEEGFEVNFFARYVEEEEELIQVCVDLDDSATREREARALFSAGRERPRARLVLISMTQEPAIIP